MCVTSLLTETVAFFPIQILKLRMLRNNANAWGTCGIVGETSLALGFLNCLSQQAPVS